jgi:hypothetical protein
MIDEYVSGEIDGEIQIENQGYSFLERCIESDELSIFLSENFKDLLLFKWQGYAKTLHLVGFLFHLIYMGILTAYTYYVYVLDIEEGQIE